MSGKPISARYHLKTTNLLAAGLFLLLAVLPASCSLSDIPGVVNPTATITPKPAVLINTPTPAVVVEEENVPLTLTIWLPPEFNPQDDTRAGKLLASRLKQYEAENPDVVINTRIKDKSGAASLLNSLESTSTAAPNGLPSLVAFQRSDLETAALKGLIFPIENHTELVNDSDKYDFARELEKIQGTPYGLTFAGDSLILVYRPAVIKNQPEAWETIFKGALPLGFPAGDPQALLPVINYLSMGGIIQDEQNRPFIDKEIVQKVYEVYAEGARLGVFPVKLVQLASEQASWAAYKEQEYQLAVAWISHYLSELPPDSTAKLIPPLGDVPYSIADGWIWAVSETSPERQEAAINLAKFLMERNFLNQWSVAAGYLPVRPSGVGEWTNLDIQNLIGSVIASSHIIPRNDILSTIGPILKDEMNLIIRQEVTPEDAAESTEQKLFSPEP